MKYNNIILRGGLANLAMVRPLSERVLNVIITALVRKLTPSHTVFSSADKEGPNNKAYSIISRG